MHLQQAIKHESLRRALTIKVGILISVCGLWVGNHSPDIFKAFTNAVFETDRICKFIIMFSNAVNGRCSGYDYILPLWSSVQLTFMLLWECRKY